MSRIEQRQISQRAARRRFNEIRLGALVLACSGSIALLGCDVELSGTYREAQGRGELDFRPDGRVYISLGANEPAFVAEYEVDGDRIVIRGGGGSQVYTRRGDTLEGGYGMLFVRR